jgi:hypothetical protein
MLPPAVQYALDLVQTHLQTLQSEAHVKNIKKVEFHVTENPLSKL